MKNLDKIARKITKTGAQNIIIHTIPKTPNWIVCEKIKRNQWLLTLCNPNKKITYNLGTIDDKNHIELWQELIRLEIETKISQIKIAKKFKNFIKSFINKQKEIYESFLTKHNKNTTSTKTIHRKRTHRIRNRSKLRNKKL